MPASSQQMDTLAEAHRSSPYDKASRMFRSRPTTTAGRQATGATTAVCQSMRPSQRFGFPMIGMMLATWLPTSRRESRVPPNHLLRLGGFWPSMSMPCPFPWEYIPSPPLWPSRDLAASRGDVSLASSAVSVWANNGCGSAVGTFDCVASSSVPLSSAGTRSSWPWPSLGG